MSTRKAATSSTTDRAPTADTPALRTPAKRKGFSLTRARPSGPTLTRHDRVRASIFAAAVRVMARVILSTVQIRSEGQPALAAHRKLGCGPLLFAMWHGDFIPVLRYARDSGVCVVVSRSPDGEILARILQAWGYQTVRGSNTRGGTRAVIDMARVVGRGGDAAVAVDGPKGPYHRVKAGILLLGKITGCPIVPLGVGMSRYKQFRSWDRFRAPKPRCRALIAAGPPIVVSPDADDKELEERRGELERAMIAVSEHAQRIADDPRQFARADRLRGFAPPAAVRPEAPRAE